MRIVHELRSGCTISVMDGRVRIDVYTHLKKRRIGGCEDDIAVSL